MLQPKSRKFRKSFNPSMKGTKKSGSKVTHGEFGLQATTRSWVSARQIESARKVIVRETKRKGKLWLKIFPAIPITKKPSEVGMGKGKGDVDQYVMAVKPGRVMFELGGVREEVAREAFRKAAQKLPVLTKFIEKRY